MKLAEDLSSNDQESAIIANPVNAAAPATRSATRTFGPAQRGIVIREPEPQK